MKNITVECEHGLILDLGKFRFDLCWQTPLPIFTQLHCVYYVYVVGNFFNIPVGDEKMTTSVDSANIQSHSSGVAVFAIVASCSNKLPYAYFILFLLIQVTICILYFIPFIIFIEAPRTSQPLSNTCVAISVQRKNMSQQCFSQRNALSACFFYIVRQSCLLC